MARHRVWLCRPRLNLLGEMKEQIQKFFKGEVMDDAATLRTYSRDASLFEVMPKLVVFPRDAEDLENLVKWVNENKSKDPSLSITMRAAGSDMSGGPLGESIIADVTKHMDKMGEISNDVMTTRTRGVLQKF